MRSMGRKRLKKTQEHKVVEIRSHKPMRKCINKTNKCDADMHCHTHGERENVFFERNKKLTEPNKETSNNHQHSAASDLFPHWLPWVLFPLTLSIRILYVLEPTNWWILHPDEIFQTIEVAHSDRYMYGFRPYEYLPPPGNDVLTNVSSAHAQEIELGMYSLRSFILPKILSFVMFLADACGINTSPYLVIKVFHVTVTSLLPLTVFQFSRKLYCSRDIGCLSAILVSLSLSLNVFGTHTIINSFLSPCLFLSLVPLLNILMSVEPSVNTHVKESQPSLQVSGTKPDFKKLTDEHTDEHDSRPCSKLFSEHETNQQRVKFNVTGGNLCHKHDHELKYSRDEQPKSTFSSQDENANHVFVKSSISHLHAMNYCGFKNFDKHFYVADIFRAKIKIELPNYNSVQNLREVSAALGLALCTYVRADLILIPSLLIFSFYDCVFKKITQTVVVLQRYLLGLIVGILIGGYCDYVTYGRWFLSPWQWYKFNVWNSYAGDIFGVKSISFYLFKLYQNEPLVLFSFMILSADILSSVILLCKRNNVAANEENQLVKNQKSAVLIFVFLMIVFSLNRHKELRFIHNALIFMYIAVARAIFSIYNKIKKYIQNQNGCQYSIYCVYMFIVLFMSSHCYQFVYMKSQDRAKWTYARNIYSHETNICLDFIRNQNNVSGVFMDRSLQISGVYSILHKDVPIFALNKYEFMEFTRPVFERVFSPLDFTSLKNLGFSTFTDITDFISIHNSQYLMKVLLTKPEYNFIILGTYEEFIPIGYKEVLRLQNIKVLERIRGVQTDSYLKNIAHQMQMSLNATVLEYEGDWLKHFGLYTKAEERLIMANKIGPKRIGTFRILLEMYRKQKLRDKYKNIFNVCLQFYKKSDCLKPYMPLMLHRGYYNKMIR